MEDFKINKTDKSDITVLNLDGFLDAHTSSELEKVFEELIGNKKYKILVNFKNLSYISSAGLGVFMAYIETVRNNGGDIKLCGMSDKIYNIFDMLGFPMLFDISKDESNLLENFSLPKNQS